jgi:signal recognition particle receptor subunit beta
MTEVYARILLWGIEGSGKTTTLETIHSKLRPDLRGELHKEPTRLDPTVQFESLAITLGEIGGVAAQIKIIAVPGAPNQAMTRKQLLDEVHGIVIVLDASPDRIDANYAAIDELRASLAAYGRRLDAFPIVLQYNKRDIADPFAIEALHRRIGLEQAAVFETIATTGHGILSVLTTISKHVVRARRADGAKPEVQPTVSATAETAAEIADKSGSSHDILEAAILAEADGEGLEDLAAIVSFDSATETQPDWSAIAGQVAKPESGLGAELRIVSVGQASLVGDGGVQLPLVLGDQTGKTRTVVLSLRLDALVGDGSN